MAYYNTQAIVLASQNYSEADRILTLLTYERGRVRAIARGARRPRNRFAALAQPLNLIEIQLSGANALENLTQGQMVNNYRFLKEDLDRMAYASYLLELFDMATEGASDVAEVFIMLLTALELVQYSGALQLVRLATEMKLLAAIGFRPQLENCIFCQQVVDEKNPWYYNIAEGGFCCSRCQSSGMSLPCGLPCRKLLQELQKVHLGRVGSLGDSYSVDTLEQAEAIMRESLRTHLGNLPKSADFLNSVLASSMRDEHLRQDEDSQEIRATQLP